MTRNGFKLQQWRFRMDIKKKLFVERVVEDWNMLSRDMAESMLLEEYVNRSM